MHPLLVELGKTFLNFSIKSAKNNLCLPLEFVKDLEFLKL